MNQIASRQLVLNVEIPFFATFDLFFSGRNLATIAALKEWLTASQETTFFLYGPPNCGRTHLLYAACHELKRSKQLTTYLDAEDFINEQPIALCEFADVSLLAIDNLHRLIGKRDFEELFLYLYEKLRANDGKLLVSADQSLLELNFSLPDLRSRFMQGQAFGLKPLKDEEKLLAIQQRCQKLGWQCSEEVAKLLLVKLPRDLTALFHAVEQVNKVALMRKRKVTIPLARKVLGL